MANSIVESTLRNAVHRPLRLGPGMGVRIDHQPDRAWRVFAKAAHQPVERRRQTRSIDVAVGENMGDVPKHTDDFVEDSLNLVNTVAGGRARRHLPPESIQVETGRGQKLSRFVVQRSTDARGFLLPLLKDLDYDLGQPRQSLPSLSGEGFSSSFHDVHCTQAILVEQLVRSSGLGVRIHADELHRTRPGFRNNLGDAHAKPAVP
jgi:hypothetical protein